VQAPVVNTGDREGDAVVQLYLSMPHNVTDVRGGTVDMPIQFLRGFEKLRLGINDQDKRKRVEFNLTRRDLSYWDVDRQNWIMPPGDFKVCLGFSSRDLRQCTTLATSMNLDQGDADTPQ
jgi:beta-glucosidase